MKTDEGWAMKSDADAYEADRRARRRERAGSVVGWIGVVAIGLACLGLVILIKTCRADDDEVMRALDGEGLTGVKLGDGDGWSCGHDDGASRKFEATNAIGKRVRGVVCCGLVMKGCTVRWSR